LARCVQSLAKQLIDGSPLNVRVCGGLVGSEYVFNRVPVGAPASPERLESAPRFHQTPPPRLIVEMDDFIIPSNASWRIVSEGFDPSAGDPRDTTFLQMSLQELI